MATEREYLMSLGLAKEGRGRYSKDARAALDKAKADGMTFDLTAAEKAKLERQNKPKRERKVVSSAPKEVRPSQDTYDAKAVRAWGEQTGAIEKGRRGKLPTALINAYLASNKTQKAVTVRRIPTAKRSVVREESVGYTYAKRGPKDPVFISEPLVAVSTCGGCSRGVAYCGCKSGPTAPKYLGGEVLMLTRPSK
ncbi:DNA bridging protein [Streptomyces phage Annadreamy]|uniref:DNA bridging protein n=2 Tax=Annadreamyvirus annadreamy TaxID=2846392 RepID=A0A345GTL6_9CAUD|nr:Lsr2-like DNA bridging protein [Streptomyces phage Annadreamy]AXG66288.1 DNA bridging protein [Streptomyces phage Annadreamy]QGH79511.1 Lsr2-like DNA bridging protein [Streptomyces phage Limpid]